MEKTWKPTTAGILTMIAGIVGIISGAVIAGLAATAALSTFWWFGMPAWRGMMAIGWGISRVVIGGCVQEEGSPGDLPLLVLS